MRIAPALVLVAACGASPLSSTTSGLAREVLAYRPPPAAISIEARAIAAPPWAHLGLVLGSYDLHHDGVRAAAWSDDGATLVSLADDGSLRVWDVRTQTLVRALPACAPGTHGAATLAIAGPRAVTGDGAGAICERDWVAGTTLRTWRPPGAPIRFLALRGDTLVTYDHQPRVALEAQIGTIVSAEEAGGDLRAWTLAGALRGAQHLGAVDAIALSADGATLAIAAGHHVRALDRASGRVRWDRDLEAPCTAQAFDPCPRALAFTPGGDVVALTPRRLGLLRAADGAPGWFAFEGFWPDDGRPFDVLALSRDGARAAVSTDEDTGLLLFWDVAAGRELHDGTRSSAGARGAAFSPDGSIVATWGSDQVHLVDAATRRPIARPSGHEHAVTRVALSADGRRALTVSEGDGVARVWDAGTGAELARWTTTSGEGDLSPDGTRAITARAGVAGQGEVAELRDVATGAVRWSVEGRARGAAMRFSADGARVITRGDEHHELITVHDARDGRALWRAGAGAYDDRPVLGFAGDRVIALDAQRRLARWDAAGAALGADDGPPDPRDLAIAPDGTWAVTRGDGLTVHDLAHGTARRLGDGGWYGLAATADGAIVVSEHDGTVRWVDVATGAERGRIDLRPSRDRARSIAIAGRRVCIGTDRGVVLVFEVDAP